MWDEKAAVNVLACDPYPRIDSELRKDHRILFGETLRDMKLKGSTVGLIVSHKDELLDAINDIEYDYDLPKGVESRRSGHIEHTQYLNGHILPSNVDEHISYIKKAGIKNVTVYYPSMFSNENTKDYDNCGCFKFRREYENGSDSLRDVIAKLKDAGLTVGYHFLHPHIGFATDYISPVADYRLNTTKKFRLSKPLTESDTEIFVEENPTGSAMHEKCRILMFMGELISYEGFTVDRPYKFYGCKRGVLGTNVRTHERGEWGGVLDVSEFCATSAYLDQQTSLQDEIAHELAKVWACGFEYAYFDGSEGTEPPFEIKIPLAQYRVYKKFDPKPLFCGGAARAHFSWHMISGGNGFDEFDMDVFKEMIVKYPCAEAPRMANDFTKLNFGLWRIHSGQRADCIEFGTSKGAAWDCPGVIMGQLRAFRGHPRMNDIFEVLRRWEDVRQNGFLTPERKEMLKDTGTEFTLLINEKGEYELVPYLEVKGMPEGVIAFTFERCGKAYAVIWNNVCDSNIEIKLDGSFTYKDELDGADSAYEASDNGVILPLSGKRYLCTDMTVDELRAALANAKPV